MAQVKLPRVDTDALAERLRDVDLSRLAELGDELRHIDVAEGIKRLDIDGLKRLDLDGLRHLAEGVEAPEIDLAAFRDSPVVRRVQGLLGHEPKRNVWDSWASGTRLSSMIMAGAVIVVAGAAVGGLIAWLYQPGKGDQRRTRLRRKLKRMFGKRPGPART